jgi:hypothetical protein
MVIVTNNCFVVLRKSFFGEDLGESLSASATVPLRSNETTLCRTQVS